MKGASEVLHWENIFEENTGLNLGQDPEFVKSGLFFV